MSRLTQQQKHWILHAAKWRGPVSKVPRVTGNALVKRGYLREVHIPLGKRPAYVLTEKGRLFATTGEQT